VFNLFSLFFCSCCWLREIILVSEAIFKFSNLVGELIALHTEHEQIKFIILVVFNFETLKSSSVHYVSGRTLHSFISVGGNCFLNFLVFLFCLLNHFFVLLLNFTQFFEQNLTLFTGSIKMMGDSITISGNIENLRIESWHLWLNMIKQKGL
jgi:hypothetical protein